MTLPANARPGFWIRELTTRQPGLPVILMSGYTEETLPIRDLSKAITLLQKNAMAPSARINEIADELHISSSHLRHLFKKEVGMAPTRYVKYTDRHFRPRVRQDVRHNYHRNHRVRGHAAS